LLIPRINVLILLGLNEHGLRKFHPLLTYGTDFIKVPGQGAIERIFYSTAGLLKLCDAVATPQVQQLKGELSQYLPNQFAVAPPQSPQTESRLPQNSALIHSPAQSFTMSSQGDSFDPYAPAQRTVAPSHIVPAPSSGNYPAPPYPGVERSDDPAAMIAQQLAPHLSTAVAAQVAQQVMPQVHRAIARLEERQLQEPNELTQAELLFEQQKISLQQFQEMQAMILGAQAAGMDQAAAMMDSAPKPQALFIQSGGGFDDLIALMKSEGFQMLVGLVAFAFALVALFGFLFSGSSDPVPLPDPTTIAPVAPIAPTPVAPVAPAPTAPPAPAAPANPVPGYYYQPPTTPQ
jgi:hypothetical protein